jgi:hypothetical protein
MAYGELTGDPKGYDGETAQAGASLTLQDQVHNRYVHGLARRDAYFQHNSFENESALARLFCSANYLHVDGPF